MRFTVVPIYENGSERVSLINEKMFLESERSFTKVAIAVLWCALLSVSLQTEEPTRLSMSRIVKYLQKRIFFPQIQKNFLAADYV